MASLWTVRWLLIFTLFALPIIFFPWAYLAFELPKIFLLYLFSAVTLYILLVSGYRLSNLTRIHLLYLVFLSWIILTSIFGLSPGQSFLGSYFRMQGIIAWICYSLLFFISANLFENSHFKKQASIAILAGSATAATLAIVQFISLWFFGHTSQLLYSNRVISTFGQPNFLGAYLVMSLPFAWFSTKQVKNIWKIFIGFLIVIIILGVFTTFSRSAYLGLAVLSLIWGFYHYRLLLAGIIFSVILFAILANLFPNLVNQQWYRFQLDTISRWTAENRLVIAQKSLILISQKPVIGYGIENFSLAFPAVVTPKDLGLKDLVVDSAHNLFLDLAVQTGLVGLALFLIILISTAVSGLKNKDAFAKAALSAAAAFITIHQFSPTSTVPMALFWLSLGIINRPATRLYHLQQITRYFFKLGGISLMIIASLFIIQTLRAEYFFRQAGAYEVSDINKAINLDNNAIKLAPWMEFYQIRRNFLLKQLGY